MRWHRLFIVCFSSIVLFSFAGCKKDIEIPIDRSLAPITVAAPGETIEWVATASDESFDIVFDAGLCTQKSPLHASYKKPALCTIAPSAGGPEKQRTYAYVLEGNVDGSPFRSPSYKVLVGPGSCRYCLLVGPGHCRYCQPPY